MRPLLVKKGSIKNCFFMTIFFCCIQIQIGGAALTSLWSDLILEANGSAPGVHPETNFQCRSHLDQPQADQNRLDGVNFANQCACSASDVITGGNQWGKVYYDMSVGGPHSKTFSKPVYNSNCQYYFRLKQADVQASSTMITALETGGGTRNVLPVGGNADTLLPPSVQITYNDHTGFLDVLPSFTVDYTG